MLWLAGVLVVALGALTGVAHADPPFPVISKPAPDFALPDQDGRSIRLSQFHGKLVLLTFFYTNCTDVCPLTTAALARVQRELIRRHGGGPTSSSRRSPPIHSGIRPLSCAPTRRATRPTGAAGIFSRAIRRRSPPCAAATAWRSGPWPAACRTTPYPPFSSTAVVWCWAPTRQIRIRPISFRTSHNSARISWGRPRPACAPGCPASAGALSRARDWSAPQPSPRFQTVLRDSVRCRPLRTPAGPPTV